MESQYYRTFIGLPLRVNQVFLQARHNLMNALNEERISWTNPDQYHVTLRFIGDTEQSLIKKIGNAMHGEMASPEQIRLETSGLASFGPRKRPRVIWVGFDESSFFNSLKLELDRILELCGIPSTKQEFTAHLTLGRVRSLQDLQRYYLTVEEMHQQFNSSVIFEKMVFFRSILGPIGPQYQILDEIKFRL